LFLGLDYKVQDTGSVVVMGVNVNIQP